MEPPPALHTLSDADLGRLIDRLTKKENKISFERRMLQGTLDLARAERTARKKAGSNAHVQVEQLADILSRKAPPEGWQQGGICEGGRCQRLPAVQQPRQALAPD